MNASVKRHALMGMALLATGLSANLASAANAGEGVQQAVVRYSDLNLSQPKDVQRFYRRVKQAAREVCDNSPRYDLALMQEYDACLTKAMSDATHRVQSAQLAALQGTNAGL